MSKMRNTFSSYKSFGILLLLILLFEKFFSFLLTVAVPIFFKGIKYTAGHFKSPSFSSTPLETFSGVGELFGTVPSLLAILLILIYIVLMVAVLSLLKRQTATLSKDSTRQSFGIKLSAGMRKRVGVVLLLLLVVAFAGKTVSLKPLPINTSLLGKVRLSASFYFYFNKALIAKAGFREELYRDMMIQAFKRDSGEYFNFLNTSYWAYSYLTGKTKRTKRDIFAAAELNKMFEERLLGEADTFKAYKLNRGIGNGRMAAKMADYLARNFPENSEYAIENKRYLSDIN